MYMIATYKTENCIMKGNYVKNEVNVVLGDDSALVRLYWAGDNLGS